jgi:lipopolysaccharide biosynthesis glycosyltransferase
MSRDSVLVTISTPDMIPAVRQLYTSAKVYGAWEGDYLVLAHNFSAQDRSWFEKNGMIVKENDLLDLQIEFFRKLMFSRINLFGTYFRRWRNIVVMDTDMIIFRDIRKIAQVRRFCGVRGYAFPTLEDRIGRSPSKAEAMRANPQLLELLGSQFRTTGIGLNGGLYAFPSALIKDDDHARLSDLLTTYNSILDNPGESPLCIYFQDRIECLPFHYNVLMNHFPVPKTLKNYFSILHFCGPKKPWDPECKYYDIWQKNLEMSEDFRSLSCAEVGPLEASERAISDSFLHLHDKLQRFGGLGVMVS